MSRTALVGVSSTSNPNIVSVATVLVVMACMKLSASAMVEATTKVKSADVKGGNFWEDMMAVWKRRTGDGAGNDGRGYVGAHRPPTIYDRG